MDEFFQSMLNNVGSPPQSSGSEKRPPVPILGLDNLKNYVRAEFAVCLNFIEFYVEKCFEASRGNPFAQFQHDGATLANLQKYNVMGRASQSSTL